MLKKIIVMFVFVIPFILSSSSLFAEDAKFGVGVRVGMKTFTGDDIIIDGESNDIDFDSSLVVGGSATCFLTDYFSLELSADYMTKSDMDVTAGGETINMGELTSVPLLLTARFHMPIMDGVISPYIGGGGGVFFNSFDINTTTVPPGANMEVDTSWGGHVGGGVEIFLGKEKRASLNLDAKYIWTAADFTFSTPGGIPDTNCIDLSGFYGVIGVKFFLN